jgi:hypothetical protein
MRRGTLVNVQDDDLSPHVGVVEDAEEFDEAADHGTDGAVARDRRDSHGD